ncbi:MAG: Gfo/Idh/MocA family protein [Planctomycetota bacterium]|jgi:predicted dehydrogenase
MKKINRREFLKNSAALTTAALGFPYIVKSSALGADGSTAASERIVMGCIGMGGQGTYNMKAFLNNSDVQVVAVCDVNRGNTSYDMLYQAPGSTAGREPARAIVNNKYGNRDCAAYNDFRELLCRDDIDAVTVCTPDHWHGLISIAAAKANKDIYCEKPLVNTIAEGRAVCEAVKRHGRVLQTGSHERSNDSVRFACELVRNRRIGKLHTIRVNMPNSDSHHLEILKSNYPQPTMPVPDGFDYDMWLGHTPWVEYTQRRCHFWWRFILDYGGGEMTDRGAHIIDIAQLGNNTDDSGPINIVGKGKAPDKGIYDGFMEYDFGCKYANGVRLIGGSSGKRGLKFEGTKGWIFIHIHGGRLEAKPASLLKEFIGPDEIHLGRSPGHHQDFINAVKMRRQPMASAEVGHRTATICHLVNIAMQTGCKLEWDPAREQIVNNADANRMLARPMRSPWHL